MTRDQAFLKYASAVVRLQQRGGSIDGWTTDEILDVFSLCRHPGVSFPEWCARTETRIDELSEADGQALVDASAEAFRGINDPLIKVEEHKHNA